MEGDEVRFALRQDLKVVGLGYRTWLEEKFKAEEEFEVEELVEVEEEGDEVEVD